MKKIFQYLPKKITIKKGIKPKNEEDYYHIGHYLISRGFITVLLILFGIFRSEEHTSELQSQR